MKYIETEIIDKLFLELSQFSTGTTEKEIKLEKDNAQLLKHLKKCRQHIIELLEYSEVDKDLEHVWLNAENDKDRATEYLVHRETI